MHINMKYYIVTIGAIFIALGIGILVGFNLNYDQELSKQQAVVINDLDKKFENLKETNDTLEEQLTSLNGDYDKALAFINENSDKIIYDGLKDKNIGIISTNQNDKSTEDIKEIITKANGSIAFEIVIKDSITDKTKLEEASTMLNVEIKNSEDMVNYIIDTLKVDGASQKLTSLQELGIIKLNSINTNYSEFNATVLVGGKEDKNSENTFNKIDKFIISKLNEEGKYIVGTQKTDTKMSYIDLYKESKISTIDNIDEGLGKVSLVSLLQEGNAVGNYGRLDTADSLLPYKK